MLPTIATGNVGSALAGEYEVANSLRFDDGSSDKLSKNIASSGNRKTWTWSAWIKRANIPNANMDLFGTPYVSLSKGSLYIDTSERLYYAQYESGGGSNNFGIRTTRVFRDPSAWYHIVLIWDTTNGTGDDRIRLYINGTRETDLSLNTNPTLNYDGVLNNSTHDLFIGGETSSLFFDGYMAEVCFIDGQALEPTSFGEFDEDTNIWKPIDVSGLTFGTNGFYLDFESSGSLGNDVSGNGNNFTVNNLTSIDQTTDTCTNNYCTLNSLDTYIGGTLPTFSNGNTQWTSSGNSSSNNGTRMTFGLSTGKWYFEAKLLEATQTVIGYSLDSVTPFFDGTGYTLSNSGFYGMYIDGSDNLYAIVGGTNQNNNLGSVTNNDIVGVAFDFDNSKFYFSKNGSWLNSGDPTSGATGTGSFGNLASGTYLPSISNASWSISSNTSFNFGNPSFTISSGNSDANGYGNFEYSVPSGYYALNTKNLAEYG